MKMLHTMLRVGDMDRSIAFYRDVLGMELRSRKDFPGGEFTLAFLGFAGDPTEIELTHNWGRSDYTLGDAYGHVAFAVEDAAAACARVRERGGRVTREAGPMMHGTTVIAFVEDPDGYKIEFIERKAA